QLCLWPVSSWSPLSKNLDAWRQNRASTVRLSEMTAIMSGGGGCSKPAGIGLSGSIWPLWGYPRGTGITCNSSHEPLLRESAGLLKQSETRWSTPPPFDMRRSVLLNQIARSFLAGEPSPEQIVVRCTRTFSRAWRWLPGLAKRYVDHFAARTRPR